VEEVINEMAARHSSKRRAARTEEAIAVIDSRREDLADTIGRVVARSMLANRYAEGAGVETTAQACASVAADMVLEEAGGFFDADTFEAFVDAQLGGWAVLDEEATS
jgi:hypothetical protein